MGKEILFIIFSVHLQILERFSLETKTILKIMMNLKITNIIATKCSLLFWSYYSSR
jgi:hypothetical protein